MCYFYLSGPVEVTVQYSLLKDTTLTGRWDSVKDDRDRSRGDRFLKVKIAVTKGKNLGL